MTTYSLCDTQSRLLHARQASTAEPRPQPPSSITFHHPHAREASALVHLSPQYHVVPLALLKALPLRESPFLLEGHIVKSCQPRPPLFKAKVQHVLQVHP